MEVLECATSRTVTAAERIRLRAGMLSQRFEQAREDHLGYPYNLKLSSEMTDLFGGYLINNLGDPYVGSHYATEVCDLEVEVVEWAKSVWGAEGDDNYWGSVVASGTEGNLWAVYLAREALENPILICSQDVHYSLPKAAKILGVDHEICASNQNGEVCLEDFRRLVKKYARRGLVVTLTCGTTVRGAHDGIHECLDILDSENIPLNQRYIHIDGALNAMVLPFLEGADPNIVPTFNAAIDSISTSGHKMIGTPMPCGILVARRRHVDRVASEISYIRSNDTTLMGSRNGHATLAIWQRIAEWGRAGFRHEAQACVARATTFANRMKQLGVPILYNEYSLTIVFPKPNDRIVKQFQLACDGDIAHAIVMPNVTDALLARFLRQYMQDFSPEKQATVSLEVMA